MEIVYRLRVRLIVFLLITVIGSSNLRAAEKQHAIYAGVNKDTEFFCLIHWKQLVSSPLIQQMKSMFAAQAAETEDPFTKKDEHLGLSVMDVAAVSISAADMVSMSGLDHQNKEETLRALAKSGISVVVQTSKPITAEQLTEFFNANASEEEKANTKKSELDDGFIIETSVEGSELSMALGLVPFKTAALLVAGEGAKVRAMVKAKAGVLPASLKSAVSSLPAKKSIWIGSIPSDAWKADLIPNSGDPEMDATNPQAVMIKSMNSIGVGLSLTDTLGLGISVGFSDANAAELATSSLTAMLGGLKAQVAQPNSMQSMYRETVESIQVVNNEGTVNLSAEVSKEEIGQITQMLALLAGGAIQKAKAAQATQATEPAEESAESSE